MAEFNIYVRDAGRSCASPDGLCAARTGSAAFRWSASIRPRVGAGVPDRRPNLINTVIDSDFPKTLSSHQLDASHERGVKVWSGELATATRSIRTSPRFPVDRRWALQPALCDDRWPKVGIVERRDSVRCAQWFSFPTSAHGFRNDGIHVFVNSLASTRGSKSRVRWWAHKRFWPPQD